MLRAPGQWLCLEPSTFSGHDHSSQINLGYFDIYIQGKAGLEPPVGGQDREQGGCTLAGTAAPEWIPTLGSEWKIPLDLGFQGREGTVATPVGGRALQGWCKGEEEGLAQEVLSLLRSTKSHPRFAEFWLTHLKSRRCFSTQHTQKGQGKSQHSSFPTAHTSQNGLCSFLSLPSSDLGSQRDSAAANGCSLGRDGTPSSLQCPLLHSWTNKSFTTDSSMYEHPG